MLLILLFATQWLQADPTRSRWRDPTWIAWLAAVAYMLHNVEEYGLDFTGTTLSFPDVVAGLMGSRPGWLFFVCVNLSLVWVMGPAAALLSRRYPALAFAMIGVEAINSLTHLPGAIALRSIQAGFVTALLLFVPLVVWAFVGLTGGDPPVLRRSTLWGFIAIGLLYHLALFATMPLYVSGILDGTGMGLMMLVAGGVTFALWLWLARRTDAPHGVPGTTAPTRF
ncbi:MAG: HXXEE domain-containing protein [Micropruina sp.]|nr:HXXEE domain-containing protein [Micropruina sp.]